MIPRVLPTGLACLALLGGRVIGQEVSSAPAPTWVDPVVAPLGDEAAEGAAEMLLLDYQSNVTISPVESFTRVVKRVLNEQGVQGESQVEVDFDPSFQEIVFHGVTIHRDGERLEQFDLERVRVIQREEGLDAYLYDGGRTAVFFLEDVRVGDIIEYSFTRRGFSPVFGDRYFSSFALQYLLPIRHVRQRLVWPDERELNIRNHGLDITPDVRVVDGLRELVWERSDVPKLDFSFDSPSWFIAYPWVEVSEYADWAEIAHWGSELFQKPEVVGEELGQIAQIVRDNGNGPHDRIRLALRFVQSEVRYLGILLGESSHRPASPDDVLARRYGDCKDKALLLVTLLDQVGIDAHPALVSTVALHTVADRLPTPGAFDHIIVRAEVDGAEIWLDPTQDQEPGPINEYTLGGYGFALVLETDSQGLTAIDPKRGSPPHTLIEKDFDIRTSGQTRLTIQTTYKGADASGMRLVLDSIGAEDLSDAYLEYITNEFPSASFTRPVEVIRDEDVNRIVVVEEYTIPDIFEHQHGGETGTWARFYPSELRDSFIRPASKRRTGPLALSYPCNITYHIAARLPDDWEVASERNKISNAAFEFERRLDYGARILDIHFEFRSLKDHVPAEELPRYLADLTRAEDVLGFEIAQEDDELLMALLGSVILAGFTLAIWFGISFLRKTLLGTSAEAQHAHPARSRPQHDVPAQPALVRREGKLVVLETGGELPARCVRCNETAAVRKPTKLRWHNPWLYLLALAGILTYVIVAVFVVKRKEIQVGYCRKHHRRRQLRFAGNVMAFLVGFALLIGAPAGDLTGIGFLAVLYACFNGMQLSSSAVRAARLDDHVAKLRGFGRPFLNSIRA